MHGLMHGWIDAWMDRWMDEACKVFIIFLLIRVLLIILYSDWLKVVDSSSSVSTIQAFKLILIGLF